MLVKVGVLGEKCRFLLDLRCPALSPLSVCAYVEVWPPVPCARAYACGVCVCVCVCVIDR
jgi:hypothetical protein